MREYDISSFIADNTRVRFFLVGGYDDADEFFFVDNVQITDGSLSAGHWELSVDQSSAVTTGDDINAFGLRAHDGNAGSGGTELPVYIDSIAGFGVNPPSSGTASRSYAFYPYVTSGCSASENDFDFDSNGGDVGSVGLTSRTGSFTQSFASSHLSTDAAWNRNSLAGWTSDSTSSDYGIWMAAVTISSYVVSGTPNGNYACQHFTSFQAVANPPASNPVSNALRLYLPSDAGGPPLKPYLDQIALHVSGPNPPMVGQTTRVEVQVQVSNPTAWPIVFSAANLVTSSVPGAGAVYAGNATVTQGNIIAQPSVGGTGNVVWNPGTLTAGATAQLRYPVDVTPSSPAQRIPVTASPASGNGTRAQFVDETGNITQSRARFLFGPLCELAIKQGVLVPEATPTPSSTPTGTATTTATTTATFTQTSTPTDTPTATAAAMNTTTATASPFSSATAPTSATATPTEPPAGTATITATGAATATETASDTPTATQTETAAASATPTGPPRTLSGPSGVLVASLFQLLLVIALISRRRSTLLS